jgi:uncharacterized protein (TIGR00255 family)
MIKSMTGFGRGECTRHERKFRIELKSVNHRFSDFTIKVPRFLNPFEDYIRRRLAKEIVRGKVDVWVNFESFTPEDISIHVNTVYADAYMKSLWELSKRYGIGDPVNASLELLAKTPDVIISDRFENGLNADSTHEIWDGISGALEMALAQYNQMRETEGAALAHDINENLTQSYKIIEELRERVPRAVEEYTTKLKERVKELTDKFKTQTDNGRLITEIAILADKSDINEELTRLESHFEQLASMMKENGGIGRKMDFLVQELNREANTIGSKSSDIHLTKSVIELKSCIEKIREQIQNVE